jgi:ribosomal protein S18 acetylase RimI-like enzyme
VSAARNVVVRAFQPGDYAAARTLWLASDGVGLSPGDAEHEVHAFLSRNPGMSFVATEDEAIVAAVLCGHDGRRGYLYHLAVATSHRRRGLARGLVDRCLAALSAAGIRRAQVSVFATNELAKAFWASVGGRSRVDLSILQVSLEA